MHDYSRRQFLKTTLSSAGLLLTAPTLLPGAEAEKAVSTAKATDIITLGRTGIKASRLAQGTGYNGYNRSSEHTRMGKPAFDALLRHSLDQGICFLDMADLYGSHPFVKDVIKDLPRERFALLSKIWPTKESWVTPSGGAVEEVDRFRKELGVDMIDIFLIHCMQNAKWTTTYAHICDDLSKLKEKGAVRAVGVSCHDLGALKTAAASPWVDVILARINYKCGAEYATDGTVEEVSAVLKQARTNGKAIVGMKIFGAGKLVQPEEKDASLKYVWSNKLVDAVTIGMLKPEQVDDTITRVNQALKG